MSPAEHGQANCTSSQTAAVQCFVNYAVKTNLATPPAGMTLPEYRAYGVAVSKILQSNHTCYMLLGIMSAIADAMPPTNAGGKLNQSAQDEAVDAFVDAGLNSFLIALPPETTTAQLKQFARDVTDAMEDNDSVTLSPGAPLRVLDSYIVTATKSGSVNWIQVDNSISSAIDSLEKNGLLKIPSTVKSIQVKQFAYEAAKAIYKYKATTGRMHL